MLRMAHLSPRVYISAIEGVCGLKGTVCGGSLAVRPPLRLNRIGIDQVFVGDVQFEDTVPAVQV